MLSLLDEIVHVTGKDILPEEELCSILADGLSALTFSMIPPTLDHVTVTSIDRGYAAEAKVVFIPGALEGSFPKKIDDSGFFTETEKQVLLKSARINLGNNLRELVQEEQFLRISPCLGYLTQSFCRTGALVRREAPQNRPSCWSG